MWNSMNMIKQPLTPDTGLEILDLNVQLCDADDINELIELLHRYKVIFIRNQTLTPESQIHFSRHLGALMQLPYIKPLDGYPDIIRVLKEADEINMGVFGGDWHSDFSFLAEPPQYSILYAEQLPPLGGDTLWVNMSLAWEKLSNEIKEQIEGKMSIHCGSPYGVKHAPKLDKQVKGSIEIARQNPEADREILHPLVCRIPETGDNSLFINPTYTIGIQGLSKPDSQLLLQTIYQHCTRPEFSCRLRWQLGTLVVWDNRTTMHYAVNDYDGYRRCLYRTTTQGIQPAPG
ncbi:MAG: taurine dioxygenase [Gammaproteobacteria bacterium]|jgi:taurine dioxygenase